MADSSPTGKPIVPPAAVPFVAIGLGLLGLLGHVIPEYTIVGKLLRDPAVLAAFGGIVGAISPGLRKVP